MIILESAAAGGTREIVAVFGLGLIGSALVESLRRNAPSAERFLPISWRSPERRAAELDDILSEIRRRLTGAETSLRIVWAAGQSGFGATDEDASIELAVFKELATRIEELAIRAPQVPISLIVLSSAGGLFEGQRIVHAASEPTPRRPYGFLKLRQEQLALAESAPWTAKIVRLTSVYGFIRPGQRMGLVSTLVRNGLRHERTRITGRMDTLRDFIFVEDVARYLTTCLGDPERMRSRSVETLASCKPSTLSEVHLMVDQALGRRAYVSYATAPANEVDITFRRDVVPAAFEASDLRSNVVRIHRDALESGLALAREPGRAKSAA